MAQDLDIVDSLIQGCTIRSVRFPDENWKYKLMCLTCNQTGFFDDLYQVGKAAGFHFADKDKYPIT